MLVPELIPWRDRLTQEIIALPAHAWHTDKHIRITHAQALTCFSDVTHKVTSGHAVE